MMMMVTAEKQLAGGNGGGGGDDDDNDAAAAGALPQDPAPSCSPASDASSTSPFGCSGVRQGARADDAAQAPADCNHRPCPHSVDLPPAASQQVAGISLMLSAEEQEQLKCPAYSDDDDDDNRLSKKRRRRSSESAESGAESTGSSRGLQSVAAAVADDANLPRAGEKSDCDTNDGHTEPLATIELRFLVRRREAGALIGKRGANIKRLREAYRSSMLSIPDTGNGPERVVCVATNEKDIQPILDELTQLLVEKSPENDEQIELKLLIHSSQAGSIIGIGGQSIKKLRNDSRAAIKIYELCCPFSNERVCAIKARPPVVVNTIKLIQSILNENPVKGTIKPYDALHFDLMLADKYGGFEPDDGLEPGNYHHGRYYHQARGANFSPMGYEIGAQYHDAANGNPEKHHFWRAPPDFRPLDPCEHQHMLELASEGIACQIDLHHRHHHAMQQSIAAHLQAQQQQTPSASSVVSSPSSSPQLQLQQQYNNRLKGDLPLNCDDSNKLPSPVSVSKSYASAFLAGSPHPRQLHHAAAAFRCHPYSPPPDLAASHACLTRPTLRHHHQQYPPLSNYPPARFIYGQPSMQHNNRYHHQHRAQSCARMQQAPIFANLQSPTVRCRHVKPCFCMFMPMISNGIGGVPGIQPPSSINSSSSSSVAQAAAQLAHLTKNLAHPTTRGPTAACLTHSNNNGTNVDANSKKP